MKVLALCLALVAVTFADTTPCFTGTFAETYLKSQDNLRCKDSLPISVDWSIACANYSDTMPRFTNFYTICDTDYTLVGYDEFACDTTTGDVADSLVNGAVLSVHSSCVSNSDLSGVCQSTDTANADKLVLDVGNAAVQSSNDSDIVYYTVSCDSGYSFKDGVDASSVYGYCTDAATNAYTFHADSDSEGCFAICPENPAASLISSSHDNLESLVMAESANGAVNSAEVVCASGYDTVDGAADAYDFTCEGAATDNANEGLVSCTDCPVCVATCPADAGASFINDAAANLASLSNAQAKSGEVFSAQPVCDEGFAIADDADDSYDYVCGSTADDAADSGMVTCDDSSCPVCLAKCAANSDPRDTIDHLATLIIAEGVANEEVVGEVTCDSDTALAWEDRDAVYRFTCSSSSSDGASEGQYVCGVDHACPVCETKCDIESNDELDFVYIDGTTPSGVYEPGHNHIEASCKNTTLSLIGERYASCSNGSLSFEREAPICASGDTCEHPNAINAELTNTDNVLAGEKYTVVCNAGYSLDALDAEIYGSFTEAVMSCRGEVLPEVMCYPGCAIPDVIGGSVVNTGNSDGGKAPYEDGDVVNFKCDGNIISGSEIATCEMGMLAAPVCGACTVASTLLLLTSALFYLLF